MRTEGFRRSLISVSLIFALVLSMAFTATPVLAPLVIYEPGGTTIEVKPGQEFTLRFRLRWDIPGELGYFALGIYWDCPENNPSENFTLENAAAYFDLDNDNLPDPGLDPIDIIVDNYENPVGTGTRYAIIVHHDAGDPRDGEFNVDLMLRAAGAGGVPHVPTESHSIVISGTIDVPEGPIWYSYSPPNPYITIRVLGPGVAVAISPSYQSGLPGATLEYIVTIMNTGNIEDNYSLSVDDNAVPSWGPTLDYYLFENVQPGENRIATLSVTVPEDAVPCTEDNIVVVAISQSDPVVKDSDSCIAHAEFVPMCGVDVTVEPKHRRGTPGTWVTFLVKVHNTGNIEDNYHLWVENDGWPMENIWLENEQLEDIQPCESKVTKLHVQIPENAEPCTHKEIVVVAESEFCGATDSDNALIQVVSAYLHAEGPIDLEDPVCTQWHELYPNFSEHYHLTSWEDTNGDGKLSPCDQIELKDNETGEVDYYHVKDVTVTILISKKPDLIENMYLDLEGGFENWDNLKKDPVCTQWHEIWPVFSQRYHLMSWEDENDDGVLGPSDQIAMMDKETGEVYWYHVDEVAIDLVLCKKPAIVRGVEVTIEPEFQEGLPCAWLEYTVTVTNIGNVDDNYDLSKSDNAGWGDNIQLDNMTLSVPAGEDRTTTLHVHIPDDAIPSTEDNITVTATSQADPTVSAESSCIAHALGPGEEIRRVIYPAADVYAFGDENGFSRSQLKFDIHSISSGSNILSAKLWLHRLAADNWDGEILLNRVDDQLWVENITATEFDAQTLTDEETQAGKFVSPGWDYSEVKDQLNVDHKAGHSYSSYRLGWANDNGSEPSVGIDDGRFLVIESGLDDLFIIFSSSEYNDKDPYLEVVYLSPYAVSVSISPTYKSGSPGENLSYTVMVANMGSLDDNYVLTVSDNADWGPAVLPTSLAVASGALGEATLTVTVPENATPCTMDNITVIATSQNDNLVSDSASCMAHAQVGLIPRGPIYIDGNDNFIPANGVTSGSGTENDPYIIENWYIDAENFNGIEIRNTTAHFITRNCYVQGRGVAYLNGIRLDNVMNGRIDNNLVENNYGGISLYSSSNNTISNNIMKNTDLWAGIYLGSSDNNLVENCTAENGLGHGIYLWDSDNNTLVNNTCENNDLWAGIYLGSSDNNLVENCVTENNTWHGILLYRSDNNTLSNNTCKNNDGCGICIDRSDNNTLTNNTCENNGNVGIVLDNSDNNIIQDGIAKNNYVHGIVLYDSDNNLITNYTAENNNDKGIVLVRSQNNLIKNCIATNNAHGIFLESSSNKNVVENCVAESNGDSGIKLDYSDNNTIKNNTCGNNYHGIYLGESDNNTIENNTCENNYHGIFLIFSSSNNTLTNNTCENNGRNGISLDSGSSNNTIENCTVLNNYGGIALYDSSNNTLSNNIVANNGPWSGIYLGNSNNNLIENCTAENGLGRGIMLHFSSNNTIENCTAENNDWGIFLWDSDNNLIKNCTAKKNDGSGIEIGNSNNNTVENCITADNNGHGIGLAGSNNNIIKNSIVMNNYSAIGLGSSDNNIIENCIVENSFYGGIYLYHSDNNLIKNCIASKNNLDGIHLENSDNNLIRGCIIENNGGGITLREYSDNNFVSNNLVKYNYSGIYFYYSDNNRIYHNNLINNTNQARDDGVNYWDNGYPSGGNYWSDYTGTDNYRGENQDIPGSDGIGDTPYIIPGDNNRDRYPLMEPWPPEKVSWDALITASFSGGYNDAVFGVRSDATSGFDNAYDIPEPPPPVPPYVRTFFYYPGQTPDELHRSCLAPENLMEWPLRVEYTDGSEDITLTWNVADIPVDYSVFLYLGENLVADMRAEDNYTFEVSTGSYDFRIVVGKLLPFTLELIQGWNMISFPVLPEDSSPDAIFEGYYALYRWDAENKRYVLHADSGSFIEPDPDVEAGVGYWAYVLENENVDLLGVPISQLTLSLHQGWNLIGPPFGGSSIADPADDPDNSALPWAFTWNARERSYRMTQLLGAGKGYWVYTLRDCSLTLPPEAARKITVGCEWFSVIAGTTWTGTFDRAMERLVRMYPWLEYIYQEEVGPDETIPVARSMIENEGADIIIANAEFMGLPLKDIADEYPDVYFGTAIASDITAKRNFIRFFPRQYQALYLEGLVAGALTETNNIGIVSAFPCIQVCRRHNAFYLGVMDAAELLGKDITLYVKYAGDWYLPTEEAEIAGTLINTYNCDVITQQTDSGSPLEVAENRGIWFVGKDMDIVGELGWSDVETVAVSFDTRWEVVLDKIIKEYRAGNEHPENLMFVGMEDRMLLENGEEVPIVDLQNDNKVGIEAISPYARPLISDNIIELIENKRNLLLEGKWDPFLYELKSNGTGLDLPGLPVPPKGTVVKPENEMPTDEWLLSKFNFDLEGIVVLG